MLKIWPVSIIIFSNNQYTQFAVFNYSAHLLFSVMMYMYEYNTYDYD